MTALLGVLVAIGMIAVVPVGLRLLDGAGGRLGAIGQVWPVAGLAAAVGLMLPRGTFAVVLAGLYAAVTLWLAGLALQRLLRRRSLSPVEIAVLTAMVSPAVAGISLVAERGGWNLLGFGPTTLALTVAHFHYAGFAAALIAALTASTSRTAGVSMVADVGALTVPAGIAIVFAGYFAGDAVEFLGAAVLTVGMLLVAWVLWHDVRPRSADPTTRLLFAISAGAVVVAMVPALSWAAGHVWDAVPHLSLTAMAATHGVLNAIGFAGCGLLAWRRFADEQTAPVASSDQAER